jgi:hypothetical protein
VYHNATLFVGVENILDTQYITFSSGINAQEGIYMEDYDTKFNSKIKIPVCTSNRKFYYKDQHLSNVLF